MVIQKAIDNLKDKPKDDRKAVAGGIAIAVVVILFFGWAFIFFKNIQRGAQLAGQTCPFLLSSETKDPKPRVLYTEDELAVLWQAVKKNASARRAIPTSTRPWTATSL